MFTGGPRLPLSGRKNHEKPQSFQPFHRIILDLFLFWGPLGGDWNMTQRPAGALTMDGFSYK